MDYKVLKDNGKFVWYKLLGGSGTPIKVSQS